MSDESGTKFAVGFIIGAIIGTAVVILCAPESGRDIRVLLKEKTRIATEKVKESAEKVRDAAITVQRWIKEIEELEGKIWRKEAEE